MIFLFSSGGNDSIALAQWCKENPNGEDVTVVYNNTGWAKPEWGERVKRLKKFSNECGFSFKETKSMGFEALAKKKKAFPRQGMQFCTEHLKRLPSLELMEDLDPEKEGTVMVGVRREESANRAQFPELVPESEAHGGRDCYAPLVRHDEKMRNDLLKRAGFEPLSHRSMECYPCVNSNRADLRALDENRIALIEILEDEMGIGVNSGKPKTLFRPYRHQGAVGIRNVMKWANDGRYIEGQEDLFGSGCDGGFCE